MTASPIDVTALPVPPAGELEPTPEPTPEPEPLGVDAAGEATGGAVAAVEHAGPYSWGPKGTARVVIRSTRDGTSKEWSPLANFGARIVEDVTRDDGAETSRRFVIEAVLGGPAGARRARIDVPAAKFGAVDVWGVEALGPEAIISAGQGARDHLRAAVQHFSTGVAARRVYVHTGWRDLAGRHAYLHAGGAIGAAGPVPDVSVDLVGVLAGYELPDPPGGADLAEAVRASLSIHDAVGPRLGVVLHATIARAALPLRADAAVFFCGPTGAGKSEAAALAQQHFGAGLDRGRLPAAWSSTPNALEELAYATKDAVLVVDDFAPAGTPADVARLHATAERLLRAQGNTSGRQRMDSTARLRPARPPRGLVLATGEDLPRGQSLRARSLVVDVAPDAVNFRALTAAQNDAAAGVYAAAYAGYLRWLAEHWDADPELPGRLAERARALRSAAGAGTHRRTPDVVASFALGWGAWLDYAAAVGAVDQAEAAEGWAAGWEVLCDLGTEQAAHLDSQDPARRYVELVGAALGSGRAHLDGLDGTRPPVTIAAAAGWQRDNADGWRPGGTRVGWIDGADVYLLPAEAHRVATTGPDPLTITERTLRRRLHQAGYLVTTELDSARPRYTVRPMLAGSRTTVLHLAAQTLGLYPSDLPAQPAQPGAPGAGTGPNGAGRGPVPNPDRPTETGPRPGETPPWGRLGRSKEGGETPRDTTAGPWAGNGSRPAHDRPTTGPDRPTTGPRTGPAPAEGVIR